MASVAPTLEAGIQHHCAGRLAQADQLYRQVLQADPQNADGWHLLGVLSGQAGQAELAIEYISEAIRLNNRQPDFHHNLGEAYRTTGRLPEARACFQNALELRPDYPPTYNLLGLVQHRERKLEEAAACFQEALRLQPGDAAVHRNLANVLRDLGKLDQAEASCRRALEIQPHFPLALMSLATILEKKGQPEAAIAHYRQVLHLMPELAEAHYNLGLTLQAQGKLAEALASYQNAVQRNPRFADAQARVGNVLISLGKMAEAAASLRQAVALNAASAEAHHDLGQVLSALGQTPQAIHSFQQALELRPDFAEAHNNLGLVYHGQHQYDLAVGCYQRALALRPDQADIYINLGITLKEQRRLEEAVRDFQKALELQPDYADAYLNLGTVHRDQGQLPEAIALFRQALAVQPDFRHAASNLLFSLHFCADYDAETILAEHRRWDQCYAEPLARLAAPFHNDPSPERRLRIGYVSPDFRNHCQAFFMVPLLSSHEHRNYEITCYADVICPDDVTRRLQSYVDHWRPINGLTDEQVADLVRQDGIDILVDLTMHMFGNRLLVFARRPAPVQVTWLAYPGTTGLKAIDYRLTDIYLDPPGKNDAFYAEQSIRLPDTFWCYDPLTQEPAVNSLPARANGYITFGNLNNFCKVNALGLGLWSRVLRRVPGSRLLLLTAEGSHRQDTLRVLGQHGIEPERVTFVAKMPRQKYLEQYHQIDLGLDTLPYNGHTTSLDSYWMGVPVVTLVGNTVVGRAGLSQLTNLGLSDLVGRTQEEFVDIAVAWSQDLNRLGQLRAELRGRMQNSPLMDGPRFARNVEAAYRTMWQRWCANRT